MSGDAIPGIVPARWVMPLWPIKFEQVVILNWLKVEIPGRPSKADNLCGWRNREVYDYIRSWDWTARLYE